ncbi:hypothetical protein SDC9_81777 [bioreactor metagenome]|uniref:Uncharacterized protein n=1 Tax=bioreactor metagenome TaxID=1076179 RepID=A0A644Z3K5_9ZZZZ
MFQRFLNPTVVYMRRIQHGLEEARMAALEHESAAEHHAALSNMYRERVRRLQAEMESVTMELAARAQAKAGGDAPASVAADEPNAESAAAHVHRIMPRYSKRDDAPTPAGSLLPQGAAG